MFNVLLGLIGVILFIGLAYAGALFLGDQFSATSAKSAAAAATQQLQQASQAIQMFRLKAGTTGPLKLGTMEAYVPRYLKQIPVVPTPMGRARVGQYLYTLHINNDVRLDTNNEGGSINGRYVMFALGTDEFARRTCQAVADAHQGGTIPTDVNTPTGALGCMAWAGGPWVLWQAI